MTGTAAAQKVARALVADMVAKRECLNCYKGAAVEGQPVCQFCIDARVEWYRREAAAIAALAEKEGAK